MNAMRKIDKEIRKMAKQAKCPVSKEYEERMDSLVKSMKEETAARAERSKLSLLPMPKAGLAACVMCGVLIVSVPVAAKVISVVTARMENMSRQEQEAYVEANDSHNMTSEHETEAVRYSREMSAEEAARYNDFLEKYEEGLFPEGELQQVDKLEEIAEISEPVYEVWNREIFLPERDLTDEELLEIIDFYQKSAYSVSHTEEAQAVIMAQEKFAENPTPQEGDLSEEEAIAKASAYLEVMGVADTASMEKSVEFVMGDACENGEYGSYAVTFKADEHKSYEVVVTRKNGTLSHIWLYKDGANCASRTWASTAVNEELCASVFERAEGIVAAMYPDARIAGGNCGYAADAEGNSTCGDLSFYVVLENGQAYNFRYVIEEDTFVHVSWEADYDEELLSVSRGDYVVTTMK